MHLFGILLTTWLAACVTASPLKGFSVDNSLEKRADRTLNINKLKRAWQDASEYAALREQTHVEIVQGGAVNVALGNRASTSDMDFIDTKYTSTADYSKILDTLKKAFKYSYTEAEKRSDPIESKWADNTIQFFFHNRDDLWQKYLSESTAQYHVLSDAGVDEDDGSGIIFIAAAWDWQFVGKMVDVGSVSNPKKPYDFKDALLYLQMWLTHHGFDYILYSDIKKWFPAWGQSRPKKLRAYCKEINRLAQVELIGNLDGTDASDGSGGSS